MENKRIRVTILAALSMMVAVTFLLNSGQIAEASECQIVRLQRDPAAAYQVEIEPRTLWISKGDCVVWFNRIEPTSAPEIMIKFREGKKCDEVTEASSGFSLDGTEGCYGTGKMPFGGTSSLRFIEKCTYEYEVVAPGKEKSAGKIVVAE